MIRILLVENVKLYISKKKSNMLKKNAHSEKTKPHIPPHNVEACYFRKSNKITDILLDLLINQIVMKSLVLISTKSVVYYQLKSIQ